MALLHRALPPRPSPLIGVLCKGKALPRPGSGTNLFPRAIRFALFARVPEAAWPHCRHSSVLLSYFFSPSFCSFVRPCYDRFLGTMCAAFRRLQPRFAMFALAVWGLAVFRQPSQTTPAAGSRHRDMRYFRLQASRPDETKKQDHTKSERALLFSLLFATLLGAGESVQAAPLEATGDAAGGHRCATPGETGPSHQLTRNGAVLSAFIIHITPSRGTEYIYTHTHSNLAPSGGVRGGLGATGAHDGRTFPRTQSLDTRRTKCRVSRSVECLI